MDNREASPGAALLAGALLIAAVSTVWMLLQRPNFFDGYDFERMHLFYKAYFRDALLAGRVPLWNPYVGLGRPFLSDIETASLYPPNLLVLALGVYGGVAASVFLHQALAVYGGVRLGRTLGAGAAASWMVGAGMALGSAFTARLGMGIVEGYFSLCWLPTLLWLGARLQDRWEAGAGAGFAAAVGLAILAGQPPLLYVELLGLVAFLVCRQEIPRDRGDLLAKLRNALGLFAAGTLGIGLAAAALLPFLELVGQGNRPLASLGFAVANGMPAPSWLSLIVPTSAGYAPNWEYGLHCGLVPLFAAMGGVWLWRDRNVRGLLGMGLAGALLAAGDRAPFLRWVAHVVPGAAAVRIPSRYGILFAAALMGTGALALTRRPPRPLLTLAAGLAVCIGWVVWLEPYVVRGGGGAGVYYVAHAGPVLAAALLVALWHERARWPGREGLIGCMVAMFCAVNWLWAIALQAPVYSRSGPPTADAEVRAAAVAEGLFVPGGAPPRISFDSTEVRENAGMIQGFSTYCSYVAPSLRRTWGYLHRAAGVPASASDFIQLPSALFGRAGSLDALNLVADVEQGSRTLVPRLHPDPRAYVAFDAEVVADWTAAEEAMAARRDFHSRALLERGSAPAFIPSPGRHASGAVVSGFAPERVVVRATADAPGILVLAEAWYPGWGAQIGGRPAEIFPVNGWMRGVVVPAGESEVVFTYHSRLLGPGLAVSLLCATALAVLLVRARAA